MTVATAKPIGTPDVAAQSAKVLGLYAGYVGTWTIQLGLEVGLLDALAGEPSGVAADDLARRLGLDPLYTRVWCRSGYAVGLLDLVEEQRYCLAPHLGNLLLNADGPGYLGGLARVFVAMRETFEDMREFLRTGQHEWWRDFAPEWIQAVGTTGQVFYRRMLNGVIPQLPVVESRLRSGAHVLDLACGVCAGPAKIARIYPATTFTGVDGDAYTLTLARDYLAREGLAERFELVEQPLEEFGVVNAYDLAVINISLHEARDPQRVVANARRALRPGGTFLVSEFPFPDTIEACRALPAQIMCGIQFFEAHINCQLQPTNYFLDLLQDAGFQNVGAVDVSPVHVVVHGTV
jgi:ubiquinone/menaquinone biosynthesis C-methylase UbiE